MVSELHPNLIKKGSFRYIISRIYKSRNINISILLIINMAKKITKRSKKWKQLLDQKWFSLGNRMRSRENYSRDFNFHYVLF